MAFENFFEYQPGLIDNTVGANNYAGYKGFVGYSPVYTQVANAWNPVITNGPNTSFFGGNAPYLNPTAIELGKLAQGQQYLDLLNKNIGNQQTMGYLGLGANILGGIYGAIQGNKQLKLAQQSLADTKAFNNANLSLAYNNLIDRTVNQGTIRNGWLGAGQEEARQLAEADAKKRYGENPVV